MSGHFTCTKNYPPERGLSVVFRQARANSHCQFLHGYSLGVEITFGCDRLDLNNWVVDFGSLKELWNFLQDTFDHSLVVAEDDPNKEEITRLTTLGIAQVVELPGTGCENFAYYIYSKLSSFLKAQTMNQGRSVWVESVKVYEHGSNSATYHGATPLQSVLTS